MKSHIERRCPPYEGDEPYLHLCFANADTAALSPLIECLYERGVHLWYVTGRTRDAQMLTRQNERVDNAVLTVVYISEAARHDKNVKGVVLACEQRHLPLACIDADEGDHELSVGLTSQVPHIAAWRHALAADLEDELLHTPGFVQELLGPRPVSVRERMRRRALALVAATLLVCACGVALAWQRGLIAPSSHHPGDTTSLTSPQLIAAARRAKGGGPLTNDDLAAISTLRLAELPNDPTELVLFCSLVRVEIPASLARDAQPLLSDAYDVVLVGDG